MLGFITAGLVVQPFLGDRPVSAQAGNAYDLLAVVNNLRASNGLPALQTDGSLMAAAQVHSEYQASIGTWSHSGSGGSRPIDRALASGYGGGATVFISENVAVMSKTATFDYLISNIWSDAVHWNTMMNASATDMGAGVAESNGSVYYTLEVGYVAGAPADSSSGVITAPARPQGIPGQSLATLSPLEKVVPVLTAAPAEDGRVIHEVQTGQALWSIAIAYGIKIDDIVRLNNLPVNDQNIYVGQKLLIQPAFTLTVSPTVTKTPRPPTRTPWPTMTRNLTMVGVTLLPTATLTTEPLLPGVTTGGTLDRRAVGRGVIAICVLGILAVLVSWFLRKGAGSDR
jgi:LysM repeat protein